MSIRWLGNDSVSDDIRDTPKVLALNVLKALSKRHLLSRFEKRFADSPFFPNAMPYKTETANALDPSVRERCSTVKFVQVSHVIFLTASQVPSSN